MLVLEVTGLFEESRSADDVLVWGNERSRFCKRGRKRDVKTIELAEAKMFK